MSARDEWVRVKSKNELRAGMTVELRPCGWFGHGRERFVILSREGAATGGCKTHRKCIGWNISRSRCGAVTFCAGQAIRDGRLYRYQLPPEATDDAETVVKRKERVR